MSGVVPSGPGDWPERDPSLTHQIALCCIAVRGPDVFVTCNCLGYIGHGSNHQHMGVAADVPAAWALYNNPHNHKGTVFTEEDMIDGQRTESLQQRAAKATADRLERSGRGFPVAVPRPEVDRPGGHVLP